MKKNLTTYERRVARVRKAQKRRSRARLSVFRSNRYVSAQIIDDKKGHTIAAVSELELGKSDTKLTKTQRAKLVGELIANKARKKKVHEVIFDRGGSRYHGRIRQLAEGAREKGLKF